MHDDAFNHTAMPQGCTANCPIAVALHSVKYSTTQAQQSGAVQWRDVPTCDLQRVVTYNIHRLRNIATGGYLLRIPEGYPKGVCHSGMLRYAAESLHLHVALLRFDESHQLVRLVNRHHRADRARRAHRRKLEEVTVNDLFDLRLIVAAYVALSHARSTTS